jgi:hypothetical protein
MTGFLEGTIHELQRMKRLAERAIEQVGETDLLRPLDTQDNSIAILMRHMGGNMRSRWTDFLTSDGEKPWRNRDAEFEVPPGTGRAQLLEDWESGWTCLFRALEGLRAEDLGRTVAIRGEPHTVLQAIHRQLTHYAYHTGQIVQLARHFAGAGWKTLSIPRGGSGSFNDRPTAYRGG